MALTLIDISHLLVTRGKEQYGGEAVNQLEHALQCAHLAELAGETPQTVAAALLHDIGHLLAPECRAADNAGRDGLHQYVALPFLRALLPPAVLEPVRLHVDAKRYLCTMENGYWDALSPASKHSLELQGGAYSVEQAVQFVSQPFAQEAIRLRRYYDAAKVAGRETPAFEHFMRTLATVAARHALASQAPAAVPA